MPDAPFPTTCLMTQQMQRIWNPQPQTSGLVILIDPAPTATHHRIGKDPSNHPHPEDFKTMLDPHVWYLIFYDLSVDAIHRCLPMMGLNLPEDPVFAKTLQPVLQKYHKIPVDERSET